MCFGTIYSKWWALVGPVLIFIMYYFGVIHFEEQYLNEKLPAYIDYQHIVSRFIPWKKKDILLLIPRNEIFS